MYNKTVLEYVELYVLKWNSWSLILKVTLIFIIYGSFIRWPQLLGNKFWVTIPKNLYGIWVGRIWQILTTVRLLSVVASMYARLFKYTFYIFSLNTGIVFSSFYILKKQVASKDPFRVYTRLGSKNNLFCWCGIWKYHFKETLTQTIPRQIQIFLA